MKSIKISPSILSANFARLGEEIALLDKSGSDLIHIDVMDGHFVPNITIGPDVIKAVRGFTQLPFDVHLMINNVDYYIPIFSDAGADIITIHFESPKHITRSLTLIKSLGKKAGVALLPSTTSENIDFIIDYVDLILVMTVNPGFAGQKFMNNQLKKIETIANKISNANKNIMLSVDGGINQHTGPQAIEAGAEILVAGSYIFSGNNYKETIDSLKLLTKKDSLQL